MTAAAHHSPRERAHDIFRERRPVLDAMFAPASVAVTGATETPGSVGWTLMENRRAFCGSVYPVNPQRAGVLGVEAFEKVGDVPAEIDLAVIATPEATVPAIVAECAKAGAKGAVIISAGFKECGSQGVELERQILARRGRMRIIGLNCLGVMLPHAGVNAPSRAASGFFTSSPNARVTASKLLN
jgi:acetyltransferase